MTVKDLPHFPEFLILHYYVAAAAVVIAFAVAVSAALPARPAAVAGPGGPVCGSGTAPRVSASTRPR